MKVFQSSVVLLKFKGTIQGKNVNIVIFPHNKGNYINVDVVNQ
jgi:hypothetical protein